MGLFEDAIIDFAITTPPSIGAHFLNNPRRARGSSSPRAGRSRAAGEK